ncbi:MAG: YihY family inner membrane protein, partial [Marinobacterium sp.]
MYKGSMPAMLVFIRELLRQFQANQGILNAAALTYTTLFAVVPLMTVSYSMLAAVPNFKGVGEQLQGWIFSNFVPATGEVVQGYLSTFAAQAQSLTVVGIVFLAVTSIMMMKNIEAAFNRIWRVAEPRKGISSFLLYWAVLSLGPILIGLGLLLTSYIASLSFFTSATEVVGKARLLSLLPPLFSALAFMLLYAAVPNCRVPLRSAAIGGLFAAILFEIAKRGFVQFVTLSPSYQLIYGAFAAVPMFLLWIYISW